MEILGWIGGVILAVCMIPEVFKTIKQKKCTLSPWMLWLWFFGELIILVPVFKSPNALFLILDHLISIMMLSVFIYYRHFRKPEKFITKNVEFKIPPKHPLEIKEQIIKLNFAQNEFLNDSKSTYNVQQRIQYLGNTS